MKVFIVAALLLMGLNVSAQTSKVLMFCDYYTPNQTGEIYVDVYLDYDAAADTYTKFESGIVETKNAKYPDYLWDTTVTYTTPNSVAKISIERDLDVLSFEFPVQFKGTTLSFAIPKNADGVIQDFKVMMTGFYTGLTINQEFLCYDPATKETAAAKR